MDWHDQFDKRVDRLEDKLDKLNQCLSSVDKTLVEQHISFKEHMRRTSLLEDAIHPLVKNSERVKGILKVFGSLAVFVGVVTSIAALFRH